MMLNERQLKNFIHRVLNEQDDEYIHIEPGKLNYIIDQVHGTQVFNRLLQNRPIWVDGDLTIKNKNLISLGNITGVDGGLDLSGCENLNDLGNLKYVQGQLNISNTNVESFDQVEYGSVRVWGSKYETKQLQAEYQKELNDANERRQEGTWDDPDSSEEASEAWSVLKYVVDQGDVYELEPDEREEKIRLENRLEELDSFTEMTDEQQEEYDEIEGRLEELESYIDVYDVLPTYSSHYDFNVYRVKGMGDLRNPKQYATKRSDDAFESLVDYYRNSIDDVGLDSFSDYIEGNLDGDSVAEDFRDYYYDEIRDNLDSYFENVGYSEEQQERIQELEDYINELDDKISELQDQMGDEENEEIQEWIEEAESNKERAQEEIDEMTPEVSDEMIEEEVESRLEDIRRDPYRFLTDMGYDSKTIGNYVDLDDIARDVANNGDYGDLNSYDGRYDEYKVGHDYYIVMRID
jgi:hypothetical protein